ncbi:MAG: hypothetical protein WBH90_17025 [Aggregatilineales bacterium]|nr:hypothetical protein [Aggregatilineales bacterium]HPV05928.1 hypothetical protein [Aggregatilineales bacterium]
MRENPERVAWRVLLSAFAVFLLLCGTTIYVVQWYLFDSEINIGVDLMAARGTISMMLPNSEEPIAVSDRRLEQSLPFEVSTDTSQAALRFTDLRTGQPVAYIVLLHDSTVTLHNATAPRFRLNNAPYRINLESDSGRVEVHILDNTRRDVEVTLTTPHSTTTISDVGHYVIDTTDERTRVTTKRGLAYVYAPSSHSIVEVPENHRTQVTRSSELPAIVPAESNLLVNGDFLSPFTEGWTFYDDSVLPAGAALNLRFGGRDVVVFDRSQERWPNLTLDHGETGLVQTVNQDVRDYSYLELRGTFYVDEQSLSTCGQLGSECPMMMRMTYIDEQGVEREYIQGFYAYHDPSLDYPLTCDSCRAEHERISLQSWYTFRSGNLLTVLPAEQKPAIIQQVRFYASGHAYRVYVSEIELLAGR